MRTLLSCCIVLLLLGCNKEDDNAPPPVNTTKLSLVDLTVDEGDADKNIFIQIQLNQAATKEVSATISSSDGTAQGGADYVAFIDEPIVFQAGEQYKDFQVTIKGDDEPENAESFTVTLSNSEGAAIDKSSATITIANDDAGSVGDIIIPTTGFTSPTSYPGMTLLWSDEFDGTEVNGSNWTFEIGTGSDGWGNNELQYYRAENTQIFEEHLVIEARQESFAGSNYTSSRMITKNKFDFKYGRVDIRAVLPYGQGIWPALWMLGENISSVGWPACGEVDIMELIGHQASTVYGTIHWADGNNNHADYGGNTSLSSGIFNDEFHVFSIIWNENEIRWLLDDQQFHVASISDAALSEFRKNQFFIFNVAVGGNWPGPPNSGTAFPQRMIVDYIRVFQ